MRARDFLNPETKQDIFEVKTSPANLAKLAGEVSGALVGIEFEMYIPDVNVDIDNYEPERDFEIDEEPESIQQIVDFFDDGEHNYGRNIRDFEQDLRERYSSWIDSHFEYLWNDDGMGYDFFVKWCRENLSDDDVIQAINEINGWRIDHETGKPVNDRLNPLPFEADREEATKEEWEKFLELEWQDEGIYFDRAKSDCYDEVTAQPDQHGASENDWLDDVNYTSMRKIYRSLDIEWPHWTSVEEGINVETLADGFSDFLGRPVYYSSDVSEQPPSDGYIIVPDGSLTASEGGLELKSAPFPPSVMKEEIKKIKEFVDNHDGYTNRDTGMHVNVSVPDYNIDKLDFVKLVLLLGDNYILKQFGRYGNDYAHSAFDIIKKRASEAKDTELLFSKLKSNMESIASKVVHSGKTNKYTSINTENKKNYIEFRSPGNDYLGKHFDKLDATIDRFVFALDAACDPMKYRKEYLKKLVKMFVPKKGSIEELFIKYQAGVITREELKYEVKDLQSTRKADKFSAEGIVSVQYFQRASHGDWIVEYENPNKFEVHRLILKRTAQINSDKAALEAAIKLEPRIFKLDEIENITVTQFTGKAEYNVSTAEGPVAREILANTPLQALEFAIIDNPALAAKRSQLRVSEVEEEHPGLVNTTSWWIVTNSRTGESMSVRAPNEDQALHLAISNRPGWGFDMNAITARRNTSA